MKINFQQHVLKINMQMRTSDTATMPEAFAISETSSSIVAKGLLGARLAASPEMGF